MHPEPKAEFPRQLPITSSTQNPINTFQNGYDFGDDLWVSEPPPRGEARDSAHAVSAASATEQIHPSLNTTESDLITLDDTEAAPRLSGLTRQPQLSLETLPNEVLTHILSHLPPSSLSTVTLVSHRFHSLVTTPHAWRSAFSRYFPGSFNRNNSRLDLSDHFVFDRQFFARLTALASWRSEYILRTRLLKSLSRGRPAQFEPSKEQGTVRSVNIRRTSAVTTYTSGLQTHITHIAGSFSTEATKKQPRFMHGAARQGGVSVSDPSSVKVGSWGIFDFGWFQHFAELYPGEAEYGLGSGDIVGLPNQMDVSQPYGMIYGEGFPQGKTHFVPPSEMRPEAVLYASSSVPEAGIPALNALTTSVCAVWIAKSVQILKMTGGLVGMLSGSSSGVLTAYALGPHPAYERRFKRGQVTARWVLCPGVPIIAIAVDDDYSPNRNAHGRIWAAVLNALGEIFYLTDLPRQPDTGPLNGEESDRLAWKTGRTVRWELVELSRRVARPDYFSREAVDGSYSPRSSSDSMMLDEHQIAAETREIEWFLSFKPKDFRKVCEDWDMRRDLKADFAGDDGHGAGESLVVINQGGTEGRKASIRRFTRKTVKLQATALSATEPSSMSNGDLKSSIFGGPAISSRTPSAETPEIPSSRASSLLHGSASTPVEIKWFLSDFNFGDRKPVRINTSALDLSTYAALTIDEDPLLGMSGSSSLSSVMSSPLPRMKQSSSRSEIPGQRARYMAVGTASGTVFVWDIRSATTQNSDIINSVTPLRMIETDSPQVTCVALTSLYLVHGGSDGLVQAWDPLASTTQPIRTINSRFSSGTRRRRARANPFRDPGSNHSAAGALCLDPDPTMLRGMVGVGTDLRYWAYSSSWADEYKASKRRLRRGKRGSNSSSEGQRFSSSGRGALQSQIEEEMVEMKRQEATERKERAHLSSRFGVDLLGPDVSDEQVLAYAQLLSEESYSSDAIKRGESVDSSVASTFSSDTVGANDSPAQNGFSSCSSPFQEDAGDELAPDIAEAIRLSLLDEGSQSHEASYSIPTKDSNDAKARWYHDGPQVAAGASQQQEMDDLELALQLSLIEEHNYSQSAEGEPEQFPALGSFESPGKDKGKRRAS